MSILKSTCTGTSAPLTKDFLLKRGYYVTRGRVTRELIAVNTNFAVQIIYSESKCCWYTAVIIYKEKVFRLDHNRVLSPGTYAVYIHSIGDLFRFEEYWKYSRKYEKTPKEDANRNNLLEKVNQLSIDAVNGCEIIKI